MTQSTSSRAEFVYITYIETSADKLWSALTNGEFTKQYWFGRRIESDWSIGSPVRFYDSADDSLTDSGEVLVYDEPRQLSYTFKNEFMPEMRDVPPSRVTFNLEPRTDSVVKLTVVHDQVESQAVADGWRDGWSPILSSLKTFLETGRPLPEEIAQQIDWESV